MYVMSDVQAYSKMLVSMLFGCGTQGQEQKGSEADHSQTNGSLPKSAPQHSSQGENSKGSKTLSASAPKFLPSSSPANILHESNGNSEEIIVQG